MVATGARQTLAPFAWSCRRLAPCLHVRAPARWLLCLSRVPPDPDTGERVGRRRADARARQRHSLPPAAETNMGRIAQLDPAQSLFTRAVVILDAVS
jgi:hypothetical protein